MLRSLKSLNPLLVIILFFAFLVRVFRVDKILGFYFDQGRDANVIWDLIHNGNFFLIGPTTGIEGIFRGPWYYWLITPFYFLSSGNPILPAIFLSATTVVAIFILYKLGKILDGEETGILAAILGSFSFSFVYAARWLSNPTPMFLISVLTVYCLYMTSKGKQFYWILVSFLWGMAMQFGSAAEVFYFPAILIFAFINSKSFPRKKTIFFSIVALLIVFIPQIVFDFKTDGLLSGNIKKFLFDEGTFKLTFWEVAKIRLPFYWDVFMNKFFLLHRNVGNPFVIAALFSLLVNFKSLWKNNIFQILMLFTFIPFLGMIFFQGNEGNVYDYYFTGYYFVYALLFSVLLINIFKNVVARSVFVSIFLYVFLTQNVPNVIGFINTNTSAPESITFDSQKKAIEWIYEDARDNYFNVDVYVPPVIPHAYDYLLKWYPTTSKFKNVEGRQVEGNVTRLYTLYEVDPPHPERLNAWLARQKGIAVVEKKAQFGGITVERRKRID